MTDNHDELYRDNLAAYALGALDTDEIRLLEDHLEHCAACRAELADYRAVSDGLLSALPPKAPSSTLRKQLEARLPNHSARPGVGSFWSFWRRISLGQAAVAVAFILLLGLNLYAVLQVRGLKYQQEELGQYIEADRFAISMLAYPGTEKISFTGDVAGSLLLNTETNTAVLYTWDLPELPADKTYQIWLIDEQGNRVSAGTFGATEAQEYTAIQVAASSPLQSFVGLGVTVEPWGGSPGPTGPNVLRVDF